MIPASISEVSTAWLSEVLGARIDDMSLTQIGQGVGLMGDIFSVKLTSSDSSVPGSVVVKLPSSFEENRQQGVALGMFEAEIRFYSELAAAAPVGLPEIYHAEIAAGTADFVIVMQDLTGLTMVDQSEGMNLEQAFAAVSVLAQIHAVWWNRADDLNWIPDMIGPRIAFIDQMLTDIQPVFEANFGADLPPGGLALYRQFSGNYLKVNQFMAARSPWTLVHQDYRVENLLFGDDGTGEVVVIDWQGIGRGPGAYDLAYVLGGSMDTELRREHEQALVRCYHDKLLASGVEDFSFERLWDDYGYAHLQGGLATSLVTGGSMDLSNERGAKLVRTMSVRHVQAALDHQGAERLTRIIGG